MKLAPHSIRAARIGHHDERFAATAERIGCHPAEVHHAMKYESLSQDERQVIIDRFLGGEKLSDIHQKLGTTATAVLQCVRSALIHARVEAALMTPDSPQARWEALTR